jgi:hypothetical protein
MSTALIAGIWATGRRDSWRVNLFSGGNASILYKTKSDKTRLTHDSRNGRLWNDRFQGIVLHNSAGLDCRAFMSSSRPVVYAPLYRLRLLSRVLCEASSSQRWRGAARGRGAWQAASESAPLL